MFKNIEIINSFIELIKSEFNINNQKFNDIKLNCIKKIKEKIEKDNIKSLIINIKGDINSVVVSSMCQEKNTGIPLVCYYIPTDNENENKISNYIKENFCSIYKEEKDGDFNNFCENQNDFLILDTNTLTENKFNFNKIKNSFSVIGDLYKGIEIPLIAKYLNIDNDIIMSDYCTNLSLNINEEQIVIPNIYIDTVLIINLNKLYKNFYKEIKNEEIVKKIIYIYNQRKNKR